MCGYFCVYVLCFYSIASMYAVVAFQKFILFSFVCLKIKHFKTLTNLRINDHNKRNIHKSIDLFECLYTNLLVYQWPSFSLFEWMKFRLLNVLQIVHFVYSFGCLREDKITTWYPTVRWLRSSICKKIYHKENVFKIIQSKWNSIPSRMSLDHIECCLFWLNWII